MHTFAKYLDLMVEIIELALNAINLRTLYGICLILMVCK